MLEESDREAFEECGPWPRIIGFAFGGILMVLMFTMATGWL